MKKLRITLAILITGCGGELLLPDCKEFMAGGLTICTLDPVKASDVELTVNEVEFELRARYPEVPDLRSLFANNNVTVYFLSAKYLATNCRKTEFDGVYDCEQIIGGQTRNGSEVLVQWRECIGATSLAHELLHVVEYHWMLDQGLTTEDDMVRHTTPWLFYLGYGMSSVEYRSESYLYDMMCR